MEWMNVGENVGLAQGSSRKNRLIDWKATEDRAALSLKLVGCDFDPSRRAEDLSRTGKSIVILAGDMKNGGIKD